MTSAWPPGEPSAQADQESLPFSRLDSGATKVVLLAMRAVTQDGGTSLESEHVALGLLRAAPALIERLASPDWPPRRLEEQLAIAVFSEQKVPEAGPYSGSPRFARLLRRAEREADRMGSRGIRSEHILLGLLADEGRAGELLREAGISRPAIEESLEQK